MASQVTRTRHAAEVLSKRMDGMWLDSIIYNQPIIWDFDLFSFIIFIGGDNEREKYFLEIQDQEGRQLSLPEHERKVIFQVQFVFQVTVLPTTMSASTIDVVFSSLINHF